jgi:hypothetical protein
MIAHVLAFRWTNVGKDTYKMKVPGVFEYYPILSAYVPKQEEFAFEFIALPNGEHVIPGFYPPPRSALSDAIAAE